MTGVGDESSPALGPTLVTLGTGEGAAASSTYSNTDAPLEALDSPFLSVTVTGAGPAPSSGGGEPEGKLVAAGGNTAVSVVPLVTVKLLAFVVPTWMLFTFGSAGVPNPEPETVTE